MRSHLDDGRGYRVWPFGAPIGGLFVVKPAVVLDADSRAIHKGFTSKPASGRRGRLTRRGNIMATVATARPSSKEGTQSHAIRSFPVPEVGFNRSELRDLVRSCSFKTGKFRLASGRESRLYFNMKPTMMNPRGAELSARAFLHLAQELGVEYVSGLEMGAVPVIGSMAAIGALDGIPIKMTFVRKRAKEHGTKEVIEGMGPGETLAGKEVLVVDDVATSGDSILQAVEEIRRAGGVVKHAACLVDREEGGAENLSAQGVRLHAVLTASDFIGDATA